MKNKLRKRLSAPGLLEAVRVRVNRIIDPLKGKTAFPIADCLMSCLAMFSLKYRSLLQFDQSLKDKKIYHNLGGLYGVDKVPSDTHLRTRLDELDPEKLRPAFKACFSAVQRGKQLPLYEFLDGYYLLDDRHF